MSEQLFEHYKHHADQSEPEIGYRSVIFDNVMPDDVLRESMAPACVGILSHISRSGYKYFTVFDG